MFLRIFFVLSLTILLISCSNDKPIYESLKKEDPYKLYEEGLRAFQENDFFFASKKFSQAELNFKDIDLSAKSAVMSSYSLYGINFYDEALESLNRYLKTYPSDKNVIYAHYLTAIIHFERISDEKKDLEPILEANKKIDFFLKNYPRTDYAIDLKFKKDLIENQLAAKEMFVARYYISVQKWVPAIKRLKIIVNKYEKTVFIEEALHRLVEVHYHLGLKGEAKKYASILGYNYNSSEWFKQSYKVLNKDYDFNKLVEANNNEKNKKGFLKKIINMIK